MRFLMRIPRAPAGTLEIGSTSYVRAAKQRTGGEAFSCPFPPDGLRFPHAAPKIAANSAFLRPKGDVYSWVPATPGDRIMYRDMASPGPRDEGVAKTCQVGDVLLKVVAGRVRRFASLRAG